MLVQRIITATILAVVVILAVFELPSVYFSLFIAVLALVAAWEWLELVNITTPMKKIQFYTFLIIPMLGVHFWTLLLEILAELLEWPEIKNYSEIIEWFVVLPVLFWMLMMVLIRQNGSQLLQLQFKPALISFVGWLIFFSAWMFLTKLRSLYGPVMVMYFFILIWLADISAYFTGKKWGKTKLAPEISPGKTVQGLYGALASAFIAGVGLRLFYGLEAFTKDGAQIVAIVAFDMILLSVLTVLVSVYGDLFFSLIKRRKGVKDSSNLLPGHGGILDRVDSILAAAPFFYAGILLIGRSMYS